ncbi:MAG TPA: 50S ribosomal protein L11 methyltransferase [Niabella sp.]|nr:50S ribosomal protein L11 methyltransferase [Niabella sp.]HOZ98412.1 50S ribosomal protein L11 methyltransferase [Niabella sp.]HQW16035.1 50S ribosomal protein L11 methyltransferase [Niabella sp.]HQX21213.1 50S ribosomal protein L11 methyltransferase [Niabella sp.]HQX41766.1 50S ribosomal protein L11 methyltransferase [Niabella sp.]
MHIQITFHKLSSENKDLLIASLQDITDGFEEEEDILKAYFSEGNYDESQIKELVEKYNISFEKTIVEMQNWNALWESNFEPVLVEDFVGIRASFHPPIQNVLYEIIITPKMSFGTGHHATTYLMMQQMRKVDFKGKTVFDFGTGTGVLAILAQKLGAISVTASDIDEWSIENSIENFECNQCAFIEIVHSGAAEMHKEFDTILANINRNVLLEHIPTLSAQLKKTGQLILSGILEEDEKIIADKCISHQLKFEEKTTKGNWICLSFSKV